MQKRSIVIFFFLVPFLIVALFLTSCYLTKKELNQGRRKEYAQRQQQTINEDSKFVHKKEITFLFCSLSCFLQQQQQLLFLWMCLFFFVTLRAEIGRFFARAVNVNPTNSSAKLLSQQQLLYSKAITFEQQHLHLFSSLFPWNLTDLSVSLRRKSFLASIFELLALSYSVEDTTTCLDALCMSLSCNPTSSFAPYNSNSHQIRRERLWLKEGERSINQVGLKQACSCLTNLEQEQQTDRCLVIGFIT